MWHREDPYQWNMLYNSAIAVRAQKPWEHLDMGQMFAVEDPVTKMNCYCFAYSDNYSDCIRVLLGEDAVNRFLESMNMDPYEASEEILDLRTYLVPFDEQSLTCNFVNRDQLLPAEYEQTKALGYAFRGTRQWISFHCLEMGKVPRSLQQPEYIRILNVVLEQIPSILQIEKQHKMIKNLMLADTTEVFRWKRDAQTAQWSHEYMALSYIMQKFDIHHYDNQINIKRLSKLKSSRHMYEMVRTYMPVPMDHQQELYFPVIFMLVDLDTGEILWNYVDVIAEGFQDRVIEQLVNFFHQQGKKPGQLLTADIIVFQMLADFFNKCKIHLEMLEETIAGNALMDEFLNFTKEHDPKDYFNQAVQTVKEENKITTTTSPLHQKPPSPSEPVIKKNNIIDLKTGKPLEP